MRVELHIPCTPIAQPRQRVAVVAGHASTYTPTRHPVNQFKAAVGVAWQGLDWGLVAPEPLQGPLALDAIFVMPRPRSRIWKRKPMPREHHSKKPDIDNLLKSLLDGLSGCGAWRDDTQVCCLHAVKTVASGNESPHVEVIIEELSDGTL